MDPKAKLLALRAVAIPVGALFLYFITPFDNNAWLIGAALGIVATAIGVPYAVRHMLRLRVSPYPLADAVTVIAVLMSLIVVGFAGSYFSLSLHTNEFPAIHSRIDALYFTVVTLGTVGYGDIVPTGDVAKMVVSVQIMLNLTLIATIIRLLGQVAATSTRNKRGPVV